MNKSDHNPDPTKKVQPSSAPLPPCFGKPLTAMDESAEFCEDCHHFEDCKSARNKSAAPLPECCEPSAPVVACCICGKPVHTCEADNASGEGNHVCPAHPDGAQLEDGRWACSDACYGAAVAIVFLRGEGFDDDADAIELLVTAQAQRIAELEASLAESSELLLIAHMDGCHTGRKQAEASLAAVMQWARGRCETCGYMLMDLPDRYGAACGGSECSECADGTNWSPAWEVEVE